MKFNRADENENRRPNFCLQPNPPKTIVGPTQIPDFGASAQTRQYNDNTIVVKINRRQWPPRCYRCALPLWANSLWSFAPNCIFCLVRRRCEQRACRFSNTDDIWNRNGQRCSRFPFRRVVVGNKRNETATRTRTRTAPHIHTRARQETATSSGGVGELREIGRSTRQTAAHAHENGVKTTTAVAGKCTTTIIIIIIIIISLRRQSRDEWNLEAKTEIFCHSKKINATPCSDDSATGRRGTDRQPVARANNRRSNPPGRPARVLLAILIGARRSQSPRS